MQATLHSPQRSGRLQGLVLFLSILRGAAFLAELLLDIALPKRESYVISMETPLMTSRTDCIRAGLTLGTFLMREDLHFL